MSNNRLTPIEKKWILYDVANSAFILTATTILPIMFNSLAGKAGISEVNYLAYWGYAISASTLIVAILGPILGALADRKRRKKKLFVYALIFGVIGTLGLVFPLGWFSFLVMVVIAKVGYNASLVFYDSMLTDITTLERMDKVSTHGYAWGYIGSCIPFVASLGVILFAPKLGLTTGIASSIAITITGIWWFVLSLPLIKSYRQKFYIDEDHKSVFSVFQQLFVSIKKISKDKKIALFLLSFFFYIDGVYTIINMASAYGQSLGLDGNGLLMAFLATQIVAFPFALAFSYFSKRFDTGLLIKLCIVAYTGIVLFAMQLDSLWKFWVLAIMVGMFQGAIQALSRSYFAKIIPHEKSGEYFGIYDICGKGASLIGTMVISIVAQLTGSQQASIGSLIIMFILGFVLFHQSNKIKER